MGSPSPSLTSTTITIMQLFVFLSIVSLALAAPMPEGEDAPAALPHVHDATGDVAEAYVHEEIPAVEDDSAAEAYVHVEPVAPAVVPAVAPVTYAAYPYGGVYAGHPVTYPYAAYPYAVYHTGCVNNVGSVVPC